MKTETNTTPSVDQAMYQQAGREGDFLGLTEDGLNLARHVKEAFGLDMNVFAAPSDSTLRSPMGRLLRAGSAIAAAITKGVNAGGNRYPPADVPVGPQAQSAFTPKENAPRFYQFLKGMPLCVDAMYKAQAQPAIGTRPLGDYIAFCMHHIDGKTFGGQAVLRELGATTMYSVYIGYNPSVVPGYFSDLSELPDEQMQATILASTHMQSGRPAYGLPDASCIKVSPPLPVDELDKMMCPPGENATPMSFIDANRCIAGFLFLRALADAAAQKKRVLVWEDGGYMNPLLDLGIEEDISVAQFRSKYRIPPEPATDAQLPADLRSALRDYYAATVELTRNGYDASASIWERRQKAGKAYLNTPFFSIAASYAKVMLEGDNIALACVDGIVQVLYAQGWSLSERNIAILGSRGNLGRRSCTHLINVVKDMQTTPAPAFTTQVMGVDIKVGETDTDPQPPWQTSPNTPVASVREVASYKQLPAAFRHKVDLILGWTGGPSTSISTGERHGTFDGDDLQDWLTNGSPQVLFLASGSTKTAEFGDALAWLATLNPKNAASRTLRAGAAPFTVAVYSIPDSLTMDALTASGIDPARLKRNFGLQWVFTFPPGAGQAGPNIKSVFLINNTMPVNFMFYGTPTEIMDMTYAQVTSVAGKVGAAFSAQALAPGIYPTDYVKAASDGVYGAEELPADFPPPKASGIPAPSVKRSGA